MVANIISMTPSKDGLIIKSQFSTHYVKRLISELEYTFEESGLTPALEALLIELRETILNM